MPKATRRSVSSSGRATESPGQRSAIGNSQSTDRNPYDGRESVVVHEHDVLNGRGVNMAHHSGNERFRALVQSRSDPSYCSSYSIIEKKALSEEIVRHIESLDPPGRFLKRSGKTKNKRGLQGPWEIMTREEAIKKARQALRDCNRPDREGYARKVAAPADVVESAMQRRSSGMSQQQYVQTLVATNPPSPTSSRASSGGATPKPEAFEIATKRAPSSSPNHLEADSTLGPTPDPTMSWITSKMPGRDGGKSSQSYDTSLITPSLRNSTPTTAGTSGGFFHGEQEDFPDVSFRQDHHHQLVDVAGAPSIDSPTNTSHFDHGLTASPCVPGAFEALAASFQDDHVRPAVVSSFHDAHTDPLHEEADAAAFTHAFDGDDDFAAAFARDDLNM